MSNLASVVARMWYKEFPILCVMGVDFGKCIEYDVLQIVNRFILREREERDASSSANDGEPDNSPALATT